MKCPHGARYEGKSDEQLMVEFYGCDNEAFDELWECRWRNRMMRYVARKVSNPQDVEDILQVAGVKVFETKHRPSTRYDPDKGPLQPWLFRIVENVLRDYFRSGHFGQEVLWSDLQAEIIEEGEEGEVPDPLEFAADEIDTERIVIIQNAVCELPEPSRIIVKLIYWEGFTIEEIAEMLGMSLSAVHRKFTRDLKRLKEMLYERLG
jgi:RNA polymerase sigma-70 factor (ECF subfamily)